MWGRCFYLLNNPVGRKHRKHENTGDYYQKFVYRDVSLIQMLVIQIPTVRVSNQEIMRALPEVPERLWQRRDLQRIWEPLVLESLSLYQPNCDWSLKNWLMKWSRMVELVPIEMFLLRCVSWLRLEDWSWNWNKIWNFYIQKMDTLNIILSTSCPILPSNLNCFPSKYVQHNLLPCLKKKFVMP